MAYMLPWRHKLPVMETEQEWTLPAIISPDLKNIVESFKVTVSEDKRQPSFANCLLSGIQCNKIVQKINQLSKKATVVRTAPKQMDYATTGSIYVFEVEVICTQGTFIVKEKNAAEKYDFFRPTSKVLAKVIWIDSKSVNVVDAKLTVFEKYEYYLTNDTIYIHHSLESAENVSKFCAYAQAKSLGTLVESLSESVPIDSLDEILQAASDNVLSRDNIRQLCYDILLEDKHDLVGTVYSTSYSCRSLFTVRRLKEQLVEKTLKKTAETLGSEICRGILKHIESKIQSKLEQDLSHLELNVSDELYATITVAVVAVVVSYFFPLIGIIIAVSTFVVTFVWSVDVNSRDWRGKVADEICDTINQNKARVLRKVRSQVEEMCRQTVLELTKVSKTLHEFQCRIGYTEQIALVDEWKKRDAIKNITVLKNNPSIATFLAGTRNGVDVVKVFLTGKKKEDVKTKLSKEYHAVRFEFVDLDNESEKHFENMNKIQKREKNAPEIGNEVRKKMNEVIKRHAEKVFANHSSVIGIEMSSVRSEKDEIVYGLCIVLLCLDESILPYGESPLPKSLEDYPCDFRRDFIMFGHCDDCQSLNIGCSIGIPSVNSAGSVGFFVKSNDSRDSCKSGFLTAAHVAIQQYDELYGHSSLLSQHNLANISHKIVHPSWPENAANNVIGEVIESIIGNFGPTRTGIDAAFVKTYKQKDGERMHLVDERSLVFDGSMTVKKRGRSTGNTTGKLTGEFEYIRVHSTEIPGRYYEFENCFAVEKIDDTIFFKGGDSGSGVFLIDKDSSKKPLGIAFAFSKFKTYVCKIGQITSLFDVSVYEDN